MERNARNLTLIGVLIGAVAAGTWAAWPSPSDEEREGRGGKAAKEGKESKESVSNEPAVPPERTFAAIAPPPADTPAGPVTAVPVPATPPNIVLVIGCTVRKDQLSVYGGPAEVTPFLQHLATTGTVFDDLIAAAPWTRAASTALLTGHHAVSVGMVDPKAGRDTKKLPDRVVTLGEHLQAAGYLTIGATANPNLRSEFGFNQGYEIYQAGLPANWSVKIRSDVIVDSLLAQLAAQRSKGDTRPVYLRAMLIDAHSPRSAVGEKLDPWRVDDEPERVAQYRHHLHALDRSLARFADGLRDNGLGPDNTIFVFVADHGEGMNYPRQHGFSHGQYLTPSTNHVPWILAGPGVAAGHHVRGVASQIDLLPTLLGLVGHPLPEGAVEGRDWSALVRGDGFRTDYGFVYSDTWFQDSSRAAIFTPTRQCQADFGSTAKQTAKGLFTPGCYDRITDPLYTQPVTDEALQTQLTAWRADRTAAFASLEAEDVVIDANLGKQLDALGYRD